MSELQIGLLVIGGLVVAGVLAYNRIQERGARRAAEKAFGSEHADVLLDGRAQPRDTANEAAAGGSRPVLLPHQASAEAASAGPDAAIDYIVEFSSEQPAAASSVLEQWPAIERRHAPRAVLGHSPGGRSWRAGLQLVSRDGAIGEADLIEFRSTVETLAASVSATVTAPEMRAAVDAARALDDLCAETDIQVVMHVQGGPFTGTAIRAVAEAAGLRLEDDGRFALRNGEQLLLYTLGARDGTPFAAGTLQGATPAALSLALDVGRTPDTRRSFESMARLAHQLSAALGGAMVDDNGNALDERAVAAIAQQLDGVCARLETQGIAPGSPAALRLFS
jgi:FtsZ-interacting cell division protein ZipA